MLMSQMANAILPSPKKLLNLVWFVYKSLHQWRTSGKKVLYYWP